MASPAVRARPGGRFPQGVARRPAGRLRTGFAAGTGLHTPFMLENLPGLCGRRRQPFFSSRKGGFFLFFSSFLLLCAADCAGSVPRSVPRRGGRSLPRDTPGYVPAVRKRLSVRLFQLRPDAVGHSDAEYPLSCVRRNPSPVPQQGDEPPHTADAPPPPAGEIAQRGHQLTMLHPDAPVRHGHLRRPGAITRHHVQVDQGERLAVRPLFLPDGTVQELTRNEDKSVFHMLNF